MDCNPWEGTSLTQHMSTAASLRTSGAMYSTVPTGDMAASCRVHIVNLHWQMNHLMLWLKS